MNSAEGTDALIGAAKNALYLLKASKDWTEAETNWEMAVDANITLLEAALAKAEAKS